MPVALIDLVATHVNIFIGEKFEKLFPDTFAERQCPVLAHAQRRREGLPPRTASETGQPRIAVDGLQAMAGHVDFGNHVDTPNRGIGHHLADILPCIISPVKRVGAIGPQPPDGKQEIVVLFPRRAAHAQRVLPIEKPPCPLLREFGITRNLNPPALSVGQMPMKFVELEPGHLVQQRKNLLFVEKVPAHVEHHAAPSERRPIGDLRIRNLRSASGFRWQQLPQRGDAIDDAPVGTAPDPYAGVRHRQAVPFRRQGGRIEFQHDISPVAPIYGDSAIRRQHLVHVAGRGDENRIGDAQLQPFREPVGPVAPYRFLRSGNQHGPFIRRRPGAGHEPHSHSQRSINANKCHAPGHDQLPFAAVTRPFLRRASVSPY